MITISIIMPCYNRAHDLLRVLQAYDKQTTKEPFEIIAIDDASKDRTFEVLSTYIPQSYTLRYLRQEVNQGPAAARNRGIAVSKAPLVLIVGDDILPDKNFVHWHIQAHKYFPEDEVVILGRVIWPKDMPCNTLMRHIDGVGAEQFSYHYLKNGHKYDFRHFYTANISLKKSLLDSLDKWFDTEFLHAAFEDVEFSYRLTKLGMKIIYLSSPIGFHYHYHTIWSFSVRQYNSGLMAHLLAKKHPGIACFFKGQYRRIFTFKVKAFLSRPSKDRAVWLERATLRLLSYYEWYPNQSLDRFYTVALGYFYYKGLIEAVFGHTESIDKIHLAHARTVLAPALKQFSQNSQTDSNPNLVKSDQRLLANLG